MKFGFSSKVLLITALTGLSLPPAWAQTASKTGPKYDVKNEVKIKGVVEEVREVPGQFEATLLVVKTDSKTVTVHVAPAAFLKDIDTSFNKGEQVEVVGCKAPDAAAEEILAREITVGQNTTTLRDDKGVPIWAGWKPSGKRKKWIVVSGKRLDHPGFTSGEKSTLHLYAANSVRLRQAIFLLAEIRRWWH